MNSKSFKTRSLTETLTLVCNHRGGDLMRAGRINQSEIARIAGVKQVNVSRWFNGQSRPTDENVAKLAKAFKLTPAQMRGEAPIHGIDGYSIPTPEDEQFFRDFVSLSDETKSLVRDYIRLQKQLMDRD